MTRRKTHRKVPDAEKNKKIIPNKGSQNTNNYITSTTEKNSIHFKDKTFLLERFILNQRIDFTNYIESVGDCCESEFSKIAHQMLMQNLFLKKIRLDPGFRFRLLNEIENKPEILRKFFRESLKIIENAKEQNNCVEKILSETFMDEYGKKVPSEQYFVDDYNVYKTHFLVEDISEERYTELFSTPFIAEDYKELWLYELWSYNMKFGKIKEAIATESLLLELILDKHQGYYLLKGASQSSKNQNMVPYLLQGTKKITIDLNPLMLDYIEAQRKNILLCEQMQMNIDHLDFPKIQQNVTQIRDHLKDLSDHELNIREQNILQNQIINLIGLIYFESIDHPLQVKYLNQFYGMSEVILGIQNNLSLIPVDTFCAETHLWLNYGLYPLMRTLLESFLSTINVSQDVVIQEMMIKQLDDKNEKQQSILNDFVLTKYICKSFLEENNPSLALQFLYNHYQWLESWIQSITCLNDPNIPFNPQNRYQIELIYLIGQISCELEEDTLFKQTIEILSRCRELMTEDRLKIRFEVLKSTLYRQKGNFIYERECLSNIWPIILQTLKEPEKINPFEASFVFRPAQETFLENQNNKDKTRKYVYYLSQQEIFERENLIPTLPETYEIYTMNRFKDMGNTKDIIPYLEHNDKYLIHKYNLLSLQAQSMASFEIAMEYANKLNNLLAWVEDQETLRVITETQIFARYYIHQDSNTANLLRKALKYKPNDVYYWKYLFLIHSIASQYAESIESLLKIYKLADREENIVTCVLNLKSSFQYLMNWFKEDKFQIQIITLVEEFKKKNNDFEQLSIIYYDIGLAISDQGFLSQAINYFKLAEKNTIDNHIKASILNSMGTIQIDLLDYPSALDYLNRAFDLDKSNYFIWVNLGKLSMIQNDYIKAKQIFSDAVSYFQKIDAKMANILELFRLKADMHSRAVLNLNSIQNPEALIHFRQALQLIQNLSHIISLKENSNVIIIALVNGFDCLFHEKITPLLLNELTKIAPVGKDLPNIIMEKLPLGLKLAWKGNHISIGQISYLIKELFDRSCSIPIIIQLRNALTLKYSEEEIRILKKFADMTSKPRGTGGHGGIIPEDQILKILPEIFELLNKSIEVFKK